MPSRTQSFAQVSWKNSGLLVGNRSNQETEIVLMLQLLSSSMKLKNSKLRAQHIQNLEFSRSQIPLEQNGDQQELQREDLEHFSGVKRK
jgi:hypothetical protein